MIAENIYNAMLEYGKLTAIKNGAQKKSYEEMNNAGLSIAKTLLEKDITKNNIGIIGDRNFPVYMGILGSLYSANTYVPINKKYPINKINKIISDADIKVFIFSFEDIGFIKNNLNLFNKIKFAIIPDLPNELSNTFDFNIFSDSLFKNKIDSPLLSDLNDDLYIMFTSGSTGEPKGVRVSNNNLNSYLLNLDKSYDLSPGYNASQTFDLSFDLSVSDIFYTWVKGGTIVILPEVELFCPSDYIKREEINFWFSVPTLANFMNELGVLKHREFPSIKYSLFCGEPLLMNTAEAWLKSAHNSSVENLYGPTETTISITKYNFTDKDFGKFFYNDIVPIGKPFDNQKIEIIDEEERPVKIGQIGELILSGNQVTKGYLNDKIKTNNSFKFMDWGDKGKLWYKTGDLVFINKDNQLEYVKRKDKQIKIGGRRIEIGEIENAIRKAGNLNNIIIVPYNNSSGIAQYLVAFSTKHLSDDQINNIKENSKNSVENIFFPKKFIFINKIPTTPSGKTDRATLEYKATKYNK